MVFRFYLFVCVFITFCENMFFVSFFQSIVTKLWVLNFWLLFRFINVVVIFLIYYLCFFLLLLHLLCITFETPSPYATFAFFSLSFLIFFFCFALFSCCWCAVVKCFDLPHASIAIEKKKKKITKHIKHNQSYGKAKATELGFAYFSHSYFKISFF